MIQSVIPIEDIDAVMQVAQKICGARWARVFVLEYVGEVSHPDFEPMQIEVPLLFNQEEYLSQLTKHLTGAK